ncbi:MAG: ATP-binding protein [Desulfurococcales archaeon]|nr:ATP-binding protein [Desulfurococcales archaeon]
MDKGWGTLSHIDTTGFLNQEIKKAKKRMEAALAKGDYYTASIQAKRVSELLRELAKARKWGQKDLLRLAEEYSQLAKRLSQGEPPAKPIPRIPASQQPTKPTQTPSPKPQATGEIEALDSEFDKQAEALIARADITWDDIAGLEEVKRSLVEAIFYSIARPEDPGVRVEPPRRFLLYGPPGTGKTMLAMAASNMLGATFINVSVDKVLSRYVGDAPRMISAVFRLAVRRAPSIVFFDEVETLMMKRDTGKEAATGLVQTLLTELDGFKTKKLDKPVIVIAATNKPWLLDEAILSRFEKRIYVPPPDKKAREAIFRLNLEKKGFKLEGITYEELADRTEGYSGRDIANACREAIMMMLRRANPDIYKQLTMIKDPSKLKDVRYKILPIKREEILQALEKVKPPITPEELEKYREWARQH